jgi:hypothetical protein
VNGKLTVTTVMVSGHRPILVIRMDAACNS